VLSVDSLTALASRLAELGEGSPEREALLERLAEEIRTGAYEVDADALAAKLLERLTELEADERHLEADEDPEK